MDVRPRVGDRTVDWRVWRWRIGRRQVKWGEAQDDDFAMSASFGFDEISATLATVVDVREDDNEGDVAMSFTVTDGGAELFFVALRGHVVRAARLENDTRPLLTRRPP